ncbi:MAG: hypothetical protein FJ246_06960 [Nitrospira sp.]|nr:hypothetical protein [Nitrospira sp.]
MRRRAIRCYSLLYAVLAFIVSAGPASAESKSIYSPIIFVDKEKGYIVVSSSGAVFEVEASEAAKPHLDKLPASGMIDLVVELRPGNAPLIKTWKLAAGESSCKIFDGKTCK